MFAAPALKQLVRDETLPGAQVQTDDELLDYARRNGGTCYHASSTCMMGSHPMSVVDRELRVHGIEGLRVIDASVMPAVTSTNTNAPTIMIAERSAAIIKGAARQNWRPSEGKRSCGGAAGLVAAALSYRHPVLLGAALTASAGRKEKRECIPPALAVARLRVDRRRRQGIAANKSCRL
jgi:choline dehydrogenase-like flavoprotein